MDKKVIIIGAGIAGLSAGCYAQMNGYKTKIYEMHDKPGGLCTAWERKGYTIDGCLHWLVGSAPGNGLHHMWLELGMLQGQKVIDMDQFYRYEAADGRSFSMYANIDRLEAHIKEISPEDSELASELASGMRKLAKMPMPVDKAPELQNIWEKLGAMASMVPYMKDLGKWAGLTVQDLSARFKSPVIRESLQFWQEGFSALGLMITVAWMHNRVAGYTIGGSLPLMRAVEKRYKELGGEFAYKARVAKIVVERNRAVGIKLENGEEHRADYVISAADGHATIFNMLDGKYVDAKVKGYYDNMPIFNPILYVALGVNRSFDDLPQFISGLTIGLEQPELIGGQSANRLHVRINNFDPTMAPRNKTIMTAMIDADYSYWKKLRENPIQYKAAKDQVAKQVISILERRFAGIAAQVEMVDVATPVTFERYTGNWKGCYEGFLSTPKSVRMQMQKTLPGLDGLYMAGQWVSPGGGLPSGVMTGRYVTQMLCKRDGKSFEAYEPQKAPQTTVQSHAKSGQATAAPQRID